MGAKNVEELRVWQLCDQLHKKVVAATATGKAARDFKFCDQIKDAARDAKSDIAEGFLRFHPKSFASFLTYAMSSIGEVRDRARSGHSEGLFTDETAGDLIRLTVACEKAARRLRKYLWTVSADDVPYHPDAKPRRRERKRKSKGDENAEP